MNRSVRIGVIVLLVAALVMLLVPITMRIIVSPFLSASDAELPQTEAAIVLGASVAGNEPSPILAERANAAIRLFEDGKVSKILVTGDNAATNYDEVNPVQHYLLAADIPPQDIFLDHAGFDTYSSMYRAKTVFGVSSAIVVTQDFHLPRAVFIARSLGMDAYGFDAGPASIWDYLREIPASVKALWDLIVHRQPQYLGEPYPITGDGQTTWY